MGSWEYESEILGRRKVGDRNLELFIYRWYFSFGFGCDFLVRESR